MSYGEQAVPRRVWGATLLSAVARQWGALCALLSLAILAHSLELADFGRFTFWLAAFALLDVFVDCGTSTVAVQKGGGAPANFAAALAAGRRIRMGTALLGGLALSLAAAGAGEHELVWVVVAAFAPLSRVPEMSAVVFQRDITWGTPLFVRALAHTLRLLAIAALAWHGGHGFGPFLAVHAWSLALGNLVLHLAARRHLPARAAPLPGMLALAIPLALTALLQQSYFWADNGFVRALSGDIELGRYNAAVRLFVWLAFFPAFATTAALPWLARRTRDGLGEACGRLALPLYLGACAVAGTLIPLGPTILARAFGPAFESAGTSFAWLLIALVAISLGAPFLTAVIAAGKSRTALRIAAIALGVNLLANALLVPRHGGAGAAAGTVLTEAVVALSAWLALRRLGEQPLLRLRWLLAGPALFALAWMLGSSLSAPFQLA